MSTSVLLIGASGSGKSASIGTLDPKTTFIISVLDKPLPFKGYKKLYKSICGWDDTSGNYYACDDWVRIIKCISMVKELRPEITTLIIDDLQYILANEFMRRSHETGFNKYSEMANHYWQVINAANNARDDLLSIFISHNEIDTAGHSKIKTIGKLLDEKITIEGLFTVVLHSINTENSFQFITQNDGTHTAKSPKDMFASLLINNDLEYVRQSVVNYFND